MTPRLETIAEKKLVGLRLRLSLANNRTGELWRSFVPRQAEISHRLDALRYSLQTYAPGYFAAFRAEAEFEKWAAVEVADFGAVPAGMETLRLPAGLYAVFLYRGDPRAGAEAFQYIFNTWLPTSGYVLDDRPHFELLGDNYRNNDPSSEEEIWIPVKLQLADIGG